MATGMEPVSVGNLADVIGSLGALRAEVAYSSAGQVSSVTLPRDASEYVAMIVVSKNGSGVGYSTVVVPSATNSFAIELEKGVFSYNLVINGNTLSASGNVISSVIGLLA